METRGGESFFGLAPLVMLRFGRHCIGRVMFAGLVLAVISFSAASSHATTVLFTEDGLGLEQGNYGTLMVINDVVQASAITHIGQDGSFLTGTVYLDGKEKGLGVQTLAACGSKGISGRGDDQDEAIVLDFAPNVVATSILVGMNEYQKNMDDPIITLKLSTGDELVFTENHQNFSDAVTTLGKNKVVVDVGLLLGQGFSGLASSLSVTETASHLYVNSVGYEIPEPATVLLLGLGSIVLKRKRR
jgi:hypothetical protein